MSHRRSQLFKKYLYLSGLLSRKDKDEHPIVEKFVAKFLRHDGALVLHMLALNCGDLVTTEICSNLYRAYKARYTDLDLRGSPTDIGDAIAVNIGHSSIAAMSPNVVQDTKRRRRRTNSGNCGPDEKHTSRASVFFAEPTAPLMEEPAEAAKAAVPPAGENGTSQ